VSNADFERVKILGGLGKVYLVRDVDEGSCKVKKK
jgi:hypothetical protein